MAQEVINYCLDTYLYCVMSTGQMSRRPGPRPPMPPPPMYNMRGRGRGRGRGYGRPRYEVSLIS